MGKAYRLVLECCGGLAAVLLAFIALTVTLDVLLRPLGLSLIWVFEITELLLVWITMLALPWVTYNGGHISVDVLVGNLSPGAACRLRVAVCLFVAALCFVIAYTGWVAAAGAWTRGLESPGLLQYPLWISRISIPFGFVLGGIEFLRQALHGVRMGEQA